MVKINKKAVYVCISVAVCCGLMTLVDGVIRPPYFVKSAIKVLLFMALPMAFGRMYKMKVFSILKPEKRSIVTGLLLGGGTFAVVLTAYFILAPYIDLSAVPEALSKNAGVTKENFPIVAIYIALCNSLLEEFFFRGFGFLRLKESTSTGFAMVFSSAAFAVYHGAMMEGWMDPILTVLLLAALFGCGVFFNLLNLKRECIWSSWLTHLFANLAINTIGMILLGCFAP